MGGTAGQQGSKRNFLGRPAELSEMMIRREIYREKMDIVAPILPPRPLRAVGLQQRRQSRAMLSKIVEHRADIGIGFREDRQAIARADLGDDQEPALVFADRGAQRSPVGSEAQAGGVLQERSTEGSHGLGIEGTLGCMFDGQAIRAEDYHRFHALALS
jgi:hypothetical protein